jgi:hypothetical protein
MVIKKAQEISWKGFAVEIKKTTPIDTLETTSDKLARISHLEANPEEWFKYYFPKYCSAPPAQFHKDATRRILNHPEWYEVRSWSRELAKSTRTMFEVLYLTLVGNSPLKGVGEKCKPNDNFQISTSSNFQIKKHAKSPSCYTICEVTAGSDNRKKQC